MPPCFSRCPNCDGPIGLPIDGTLDGPGQKDEEKMGQEQPLGQEQLPKQEPVQVLFCDECRGVVSPDPNGVCPIDPNHLVFPVQSTPDLEVHGGSIAPEGPEHENWVCIHCGREFESDEGYCPICQGSLLLEGNLPNDERPI